MYTKNQQAIIRHTKEKVKTFFNSYPADAHNFDHALRVSKWAVIIAAAEKDNILLAELSGLLHDIGRAKETVPGNTKTHHELSYEICQQWFREDKAFAALSKKDKLTILYTLRYHWNDAANKYKTAWILRDADKLDSFGQIGVKRTIEFFKNDDNIILHDLRLRYEMLHNLRSKKTQQIVKSKNLFKPVQNYQHRLLKSKIKSVEL
ncbi:MAG TPA: HD domain-containing protein [Candidatus Udaeobacter sp.]|nr:HD domain-containing protein [Candidatus Udaeobacter sp.]